MVIQDTSDLLAAVLNKLFGLFGVNQIVINKSDLLNLFLECDIFIPTDKIVHLALTISNDKLVDLSAQNGRVYLSQLTMGAHICLLRR